MYLRIGLVFAIITSSMTFVSCTNASMTMDETCDSTREVCFLLGMNGSIKCDKEVDCVGWATVNFDGEQNQIKVETEMMTKNRTVFGKLKYWVLLGLSYDENIGNDLVFFCNRTEHDFEAMIGFLESLSNEPQEIAYPVVRVHAAELQVIAGGIGCVWEMNVPIKILAEKIYYGDQPTYLFLAFGSGANPATGGSLNSQMTSVGYSLSAPHQGPQTVLEPTEETEATETTAKTEKVANSEDFQQAEDQTRKSGGFPYAVVIVIGILLLIALLATLTILGVYKLRRHDSSIDTTEKEPGKMVATSSKSVQSKTSKTIVPQTSKGDHSLVSKTARSELSKVIHSKTSKTPQSKTSNIAQSRTSNIVHSKTSKVPHTQTLKIIDSQTSRIVYPQSTKTVNPLTSRKVRSRTPKRRRLPTPMASGKELFTGSALDYRHSSARKRFPPKSPKVPYS